MQPAYRELLKFMRDEYVPARAHTLAADDLPDGKAYYRQAILEFTTLDIDPAEIHQIGLAEVASCMQQMVDAMQETGFKGDFPAFLKFLRTDPQFYAKTPRRAARCVPPGSPRSSTARRRTYFGYLPRARFAIKPVPPDIAPFYTVGPRRPGRLSAQHLRSAESRPLYNLTALTLHESAPGHAFQMPHRAGAQGPCRSSASTTYISAYGEGWALYCEKLGVEMGMYDTPYDRFGMLGYQIWRAARLVVDTGIHSQGWTREQAIDYLRDNTALPEHEIETEVDRYIAWPGQALSYYLGEMAIVEGARQRRRRRWGRSSTSAPSTTRCWSWARCRCRC